MAITRENLKEILRNEVMSEFSHIPENENEIDIHFSKKFNNKMDKLISLQKRSCWNYVNTFSKRVAILCLVFLSLFMTACSIDKIREPIVNFIKDVHKDFIQYFFEGDTVEEISYEYKIYELPEGFRQIDINRSEGRIITVYESIDGDKIEFTQMTTETITHYIDAERGHISVEKIEGVEVEFYEHKELITSI